MQNIYIQTKRCYKTLFGRTKYTKVVVEIVLSTHLVPLEEIIRLTWTSNIIIAVWFLISAFKPSNIGTKIIDCILDCTYWLFFNLRRWQRGLLDGNTAREGTVGTASQRHRPVGFHVNAGRRNKRLQRYVYEFLIAKRPRFHVNGTRSKQCLTRCRARRILNTRWRIN